MEVHISANAFWALLISAIEVYKKECYGILLGYRDGSSNYVIEHAVSYQTADRRHGSVEKNRRASQRMHKFIGNLPHLSMIGDFHSHTAWGELKSVGSLSETDVGDMKPEQLTLIVVLNDKRRASAWKYNKNGTLSGTVDDYHFQLGAYYLDDRGRSRRANLFCPYAIGFNAKEIPQKVFMRTAVSSPRWLKSKA